MKKLILAIAIVLGSLITTNINAQKADKIDPVAAIAKGNITKPNPQIMSTIADLGLAEFYATIEHLVTWYTYKGLIYARYDTGMGVLVVVFTPKGEILAAFQGSTQIYPQLS